MRHRFNPWVGKIPGGGHGNSLQYSCLENLMDRGARQSAVQSQTCLKQLSSSSKPPFSLCPCNKAFSPPDSIISVCLASLSFRHMNLCQVTVCPSSTPGPSLMVALANSYFFWSHFPFVKEVVVLGKFSRAFQVKHSCLIQGNLWPQLLAVEIILAAPLRTSSLGLSVSISLFVSVCPTLLLLFVCCCVHS